MRGKILFGLFVFTLVAMFAAIKYRQSLDVQAAAEFKAGHVRATPDTSAAKMIDIATAGSPTRSPAEARAAAAPSDLAFQQWISTEAKSLDNLSVNGGQKQAEIQEIVKKITPSQARQLRQTVMHPQAPTAEKILSAYLLVEGGLNTREEMRLAIAAPLKEKGGEVHSEGEINGVREKSLRIMMIDGLFAQAQKDLNARETLARAIVDSEDPYIKAYAQEKFDQLSKQ